MANLKIEERVVIKAPVEAVWRFLLDPEQVVRCLPGAGYDGKESENVFLGHLKVKVGPVTTIFAGKATMSDIDAAAHTLRITGEGKDKNGAGTAKMVMFGKVTEVADGAELSVEADVDIAGKLVTFGRGLIKSVSAQLFKQFAARAQELVAGEAAPAGGDGAAEAADGAAEAAAAAEATPSDAGAAEPTAASKAGNDGAAPEATAGAEPAATAESAAAGTSVATPAVKAPAATPTAKAPAATATAAPSRAGGAALTKRPPPQEESLNALSLVFRAIASSIADFFRRLWKRKT
jgi:uncharacterized protein